MISSTVGDIGIALPQIRSVAFGAANEADLLELANGDQLRGTITTSGFPLRTSFGEVVIPKAVLAELLVLNSPHGLPTVEWVLLPFPADSDWLAPRGEAAQVKDGEVLLRGQPVRSRETFAVPCRIEFDFVCEEAPANDGAIGVQLLPPGQPLNQRVRECVQLWLGYHSPGGRNGFVMFQRFADSVRGETIWGENAVRFETGSPTRLRLDVLPDKTVLTLGDQAVEVPSAKIPYERFQVQLQGWQPKNRWRIKHLRVMPLKN